MYRIPNTDRLLPCEAEGCPNSSPASRTILVNGTQKSLCDEHAHEAREVVRAKLGLPPLANTPGGTK